MIDNKITEIDNYKPKNLKINKNIKYENIKNDYVISSLTIFKYYIIYCTYKKLFFLDLKQNKTNEINPPKEVNLWVPTGVKYNKKNDLLYVANYLGENVLLFKLIEKISEDTTIHLKLVEEIVDGIVGPENLDITNDGKYLTVADYNGCSILLFKYIDGKHIKLWSTHVGYPHGISFSPDEESAKIIEEGPIRGMTFIFFS